MHPGFRPANSALLYTTSGSSGFSRKRLQNAASSGDGAAIGGPVRALVRFDCAIRASKQPAKRMESIATAIIHGFASLSLTGIGSVTGVGVTGSPAGRATARGWNVRTYDPFGISITH